MYSVWVPNNANNPTDWIRVTKNDGAQIEYKHLGRARTLAHSMVERIKHPCAQIRNDEGQIVETVGTVAAVPVVSDKKAPASGIFMWQEWKGESRGLWHVDVYLSKRHRSYTAEFSSREGAMADMARVQATYTKLQQYEVICGE